MRTGRGGSHPRVLGLRRAGLRLAGRSATGLGLAAGAGEPELRSLAPRRRQEAASITPGTRPLPLPSPFSFGSQLPVQRPPRRLRPLAGADCGPSPVPAVLAEPRQTFTPLVGRAGPWSRGSPRASAQRHCGWQRSATLPRRAAPRGRGWLPPATAGGGGPGAFYPPQTSARSVAMEKPAAITTLHKRRARIGRAAASTQPPGAGGGAAPAPGLPRERARAEERWLVSQTGRWVAKQNGAGPEQSTPSR